jgi:predicted Rossmann fold flavoprotein
MNTWNYDLVIVGGGAAGMMAAISSKRNNPDLSVCILDRTFALGRKILVCGAGRCNITNVNLDMSIDSHYYGATPEFIRSIFKQFSYKDIVNFFEELGAGLYVERKTDIGKLFPITDQAKTITEMMLDELNRLNVDIFLNHEVKKINKTADSFKIEVNEIDQSGKTLNNKTFSSKYLIISAGGKTYPALGSNGTGYDLAISLGHSVISPVPSALPVEGSSQITHELQGVKMEIEVTSIIDGKEIKITTDDVMFTKYGLSGPAILNISREISIHFNREKKNNVFIKLNFFPGKTKNDVENILKERWDKRKTQTIEKSLYGIFPNKIARTLVKLTGIDTEKKVNQLSVNEIETLINSLTNTRIKVTGTRGWNEAEFTAGGINSEEIKSVTLESKLIDNLYFCGEIIDVDGDVGGFNLSWSWSSGFIAGKLM